MYVSFVMLENLAPRSQPAILQTGLASLRGNRLLNNGVAGSVLSRHKHCRACIAEPCTLFKQTRNRFLEIPGIFAFMCFADSRFAFIQQTSLHPSVKTHKSLVANVIQVAICHLSVQRVNEEWRSGTGPYQTSTL